MRVWQGNYYVRCVRRKSRGVAAEGFAVEKISACLCFARGSRGSCGSEVFRFLFQRKVQNNLLRNLLSETEYLS
jgi:hypothetical protein